MTNVQLLNEWRLTVSTEDFRVILKALRGTLTEDEKTTALILGETLSKARAGVTETALRENDKLLNNLGKKT